jgi:outer membrane protein assembly factor BamA
MELKTRPEKQCGFLLLLTCLFVCGLGSCPEGGSQQPDAPPVAPALLAVEASPPNGALDEFSPWMGKPVRKIIFDGVPEERIAPLAGHLAQAEGKPLSREELRRSLRQLFATGLYETVQAEAVPEQDGLTLLFRGQPRQFIGVVSVDGAKGATLNAQLEQASRLIPGERFTQEKLAKAQDLLRQALADNGFHQPAITYVLTPHPEDQLVDIAFHVESGAQARIGTVEVSGDAGISPEDLRKYAHLSNGARVQRESGSRALEGVLKHYQKEQRLEADVKLAAQPYSQSENKTGFVFAANRGPVVRVTVEGANLGPAKIKHLVPVFEEGSVDDDLLNEGNRRLRDYYQRLGYFDVKVEHQQKIPDAAHDDIIYTVHLGQRRHVAQVTVAGNHFFNAATLKEMLSVHAANTLDHHGAYSQTLVTADVSALQALYRNNGFPAVKVTSEVGTPEARPEQTPSSTTAPLRITYRIEEGERQRVGTVRIEIVSPEADKEGLPPFARAVASPVAANVDQDRIQKLTALLSTVPGQGLSPQSLAGDRDSLLTDYLSRGFDQAQVEVAQSADATDPAKVDVVFRIHEGKQIFVRKVLLSGLHFTRQDAVERAITIHAGDPLNLTALQQTQRNLYEFALFNEIETAVENPSGGETYKTVLIQAAEARRWALTYGFGFEAQSGAPQSNCSTNCPPNGTTNISPRVLLNITRNGLFGREQSASLRGTYGLLEQKIDLLFQNPHFEGNRNFGLTLTGGYANSHDVSTYVASKLEAGMHWTEHFDSSNSFFTRANTFIYEYDFRRVKVAKNSLQVGADELTDLSAAVRVAGLGFNWTHDTRDSQLDAHRGTSTSVQEFFSTRFFGAEAEFNRLDLSNASYSSFDKGRFVLARSTRYAQERAYGAGGNELIPLPERLYAGGANSLRGFAINQAGPRDPQTGFPVGGAGVLVNSTEMRLPPPTLPWFGDTLSVVLFHDMGNVFAGSSDVWPSTLRIHQPNRDSCAELNQPEGAWTSTGPLGVCSFNYFVHAPGAGLRYHTPVGPIRLDFSYNLNPPVYPVITDTTAPHVGEASHFNFFFSLGQTF